jgi:hypothetical protein
MHGHGGEDDNDDEHTAIAIANEQANWRYSLKNLGLFKNDRYVPAVGLHRTVGILKLSFFR